MHCGLETEVEVAFELRGIHLVQSTKACVGVDVDGGVGGSVIEGVVKLTVIKSTEGEVDDTGWRSRTRSDDLAIEN